MMILDQYYHSTPIERIKKSVNNSDMDYVIYDYFMKNKHKMSDSQQKDFFISTLDAFELNEGLFSSWLTIIDDNISPQVLNDIINELEQKMKKYQKSYYSLILGHNDNYYNVIKKLENTDKEISELSRN